MFWWLKGRRRAAIRARPFPPGWRAIIEKNVPYAASLSQSDREELCGHVQVFLAEKHFEGCAGLEITDEVRVTIAAQACVLLLHRATNYYPNLISILVYPTTYLAPAGQRAPDGRPPDAPQARLGESWARDVMVLAWDSVVSGASDIHDGHNVVLHEFAHQLDQEDGASDGAPVLPRRSMYVAWARVLGHDFDRLAGDIKRHHRTLIDRYGATNPAEFFAVVTETFFEKPRQLRSKHPELYGQLQLFYGQDPAELRAPVPSPARPGGDA
jgi:MtfA peptidase